MHLFAGAGGGLLADLILGHDPICAVEWDAYACAVLRERAAEGWFPSLHVWEGDVRLFDPSEYAGRVDCIHAGFPCQDISLAGNGAGVAEGTRSGLYREVLRVAGVVRPRYLFLENVSAILSNGLGTVLGDLAALGYDAKWTCIRASDVGAPHHRDRWWLLADSELRRVQERRGTVNACEDGGQLGGIFSHVSQGLRQQEKEVLADSLQPRREEFNASAITEEQEQHTGRNAAGRGVAWWEAESCVDRVANGMAYRVDRIKALGNGQVPLQAAAAWIMLGGE